MGGVIVVGCCSIVCEFTSHEGKGGRRPHKVGAAARITSKRIKKSYKMNKIIY